MTREWDAVAYDELPLPHVEWGRRTIERLNLTGHERVLDAGCGTGRDAVEVLNRFPDVDLVGVDASVQMIDQAVLRAGGRAAFATADLVGDLEPLEKLGRGGKFDAVMSVACFHWIRDQQGLFESLVGLLRPGGWLVSDSGGEGNIANVERAIADVTGESYEQAHFASVESTRRNLQAAGFTANSVSLRPHPVRIDNPEIMTQFLRTVCLGRYVTSMSPADANAFADAVRRAMPEPILDYVRLEVHATA